MDEKTSAEIMVLVAADRWAREVMRSNKKLNFTEQKLIDAVMHHKIVSKNIGMALVASDIPKPATMPKDFPVSDSERTTKRYSERSTVPNKGATKK